MRVQWEEVAVAVQRFVRRTGAALAGREQLLVRDVLRVERVLLALQAATAQGIAQGGGQCAERGCHEEVTRGVGETSNSKGDNAVLNVALEVPLQA